MSSIKETAEQIADGWTHDEYHNQKLVAAIEQALRDRDERAAKIADGVEEDWLTNARNIARADDMIGSLAQSTYTSYADIAGKIATAIRKEDTEPSHDR